MLRFSAPEKNGPTTILMGLNGLVCVCNILYIFKWIAPLNVCVCRGLEKERESRRDGGFILQGYAEKMHKDRHTNIQTDRQTVERAGLGDDVGRVLLLN